MPCLPVFLGREFFLRQCLSSCTTIPYLQRGPALTCHDTAALPLKFMTSTNSKPSGLLTWLGMDLTNNQMLLVPFYLPHTLHQPTIPILSPPNTTNVKIPSQMLRTRLKALLMTSRQLVYSRCAKYLLRVSRLSLNSR